MITTIEQEVLEELNNSNLAEYASYLGLDSDDLEDLQSDIEFDDCSGN